MMPHSSTATTDLTSRKFARQRHLAAGLFAALVAGAAIGAACAPRAATGAREPSPASGSRPTAVAGGERAERAGRLDGSDRLAMIAVAGKARVSPVSATGAWLVDEQGGRTRLVRGGGGEPWRIERRGPLLRVAGDGNDATPWREGPFVVRPDGNGSFITYDGRRYRGELWFTATDTGILVVNRLPVEDYLRGVVPLEIGTRNEADRAAIEAQAIAARTYAYVRVPSGSVQVPVSGWHMVATVANQVYGGMEAENAVVNSAIDATAGLVLRYNGLLTDAPYYSSCGGRTATPREAWRDARDEPYLQSVSDINPATGRPWCEISPRHEWAASFDEQQLSDVARRALAAVGKNAPVGTRVRSITVAERLPSGRVGTLQFETDHGSASIRIGEIRNVLRDVRGAILSSTYFTVDRESRGHGHLTGVTLRGVGNGHGVGMCQWGAIARARAGHDSRAILRHYYPGTVVGFAD